jgi:hypothetical protein
MSAQAAASTCGFASVLVSAFCAPDVLAQASAVAAIAIRIAVLFIIDLLLQ